MILNIDEKFHFHDEHTARILADASAYRLLIYEDYLLNHTCPSLIEQYLYLAVPSVEVLWQFCRQKPSLAIECDLSAYIECQFNMRIKYRNIMAMFLRNYIAKCPVATLRYFVARYYDIELKPLRKRLEKIIMQDPGCARELFFYENS